MSLEKWAIYIVAAVIAVLLGITVFNAESRSDYAIERRENSEVDPGTEVDFDDARDWDYRTPADKKETTPPREIAKLTPSSGDREAPAPTAPRTTLVKAGETYSHIAARVYGKSGLYSLLVDANPNKPARALREGDEIVVPPLARAKKASPKKSRAEGLRKAADGRRTHRVRRGETFTAIAARYYRDSGRWREIAAANPKIGGPKGLRPGQEIVIP
jgi:nucleoid-associated protein YgaU